MFKIVINNIGMRIIIGKEMSYFFEWIFIFVSKPSNPYSGLIYFSNLEGSSYLMIKIYNPCLLSLLYSLMTCGT